MNPKTPILFSLLALFLLAGCAEESPMVSQDEPIRADAADYHTPASRAIEADLRALEIFDPATLNRGDLGRPAQIERRGVVTVPAGSVDALALAIATAGPRGTVRVESGMHTESQSIVIKHPITILGERGAIVEVSTQPYPDVFEVDPAFHILDANDGPHRVTIVGLEIRPAGAVGGWGFLVENTSRAAILYNKVVDHQGGVMLEQADDARILGNRIDLVPSAAEHGIVVINGDRAGIAANSISGSVFGIWACDEDGYAVGNELTSNLIGLIYCKVPEGLYPLPNGNFAGSENSATKWYGALNQSTQNAWGYMVVDGANQSVLAFNGAEANDFYDVHVVPETDVLFGFCTPAAFDNTVITLDPSDVIKDCGINTTVVGGTLVDLSVDPCEPPCAGASPAGDDPVLQRDRLTEVLQRIGR